MVVYIVGLLILLGKKGNNGLRSVGLVLFLFGDSSLRSRISVTYLSCIRVDLLLFSSGSALG